MLQPIVRRTWAPIGVTPIHVASARHDRLSVIAALTVSPQRRCVGMCFRIHSDNIKAPDVTSFIREVRRTLGSDLYVVWDRLSAHRTAERELADLGDAVRFEYLPGYAPELNPVEQIWSHSKHGELANHSPEDIGKLFCIVFDSLYEKQCRRDLLANFFKHAELPL